MRAKKGGLGDRFGLIRAQISSNMLQTTNYRHMALICVDDACKIQVSGFSITSHIVKHTALFHAAVYQAKERVDGLPRRKR